MRDGVWIASLVVIVAASGCLGAGSASPTTAHSPPPAPTGRMTVVVKLGLRTHVPVTHHYVADLWSGRWHDAARRRGVRIDRDYRARGNRALPVSAESSGPSPRPGSSALTTTDSTQKSTLNFGAASRVRW